MKAIMLTVRGLRCDEPGCGYDQDEPCGEHIEDWKIWLNAPCPKCGSSLLTQADLNTLTGMLKLFRILNTLLWPLAWLCEFLGLKRASIDLGMDGSGKINPKRIS